MQGTTNQNQDFFKSKVLGHPAGLFVLFFTEMWERFSYYGMRALLVLFLVSAFGLGGWDWPRGHALALYGTYTALVYITPIIGGAIADKFMGYKKAVILGALIMTLGHASMAIESNHIFLYIGIGLLIVGNGFFKPNMTSIISHMYKDVPEKKDGAFTIFYMGVNAGAFLGILLCGYIGENVGWNYGFGLAGIFMFLGMVQFYLSQKIFGSIGDKPVVSEDKDPAEQLEFEGDKLNPFTMMDKILMYLSATIGVTWILNDPISKITGNNFLMFNEIDYSSYYIGFGLLAFLVLLISRIVRYPIITRDRMVAIIFFAIMTVIFWMCFEQAGGSMTIFAKDYTNRLMTGNYYYVYLVVNIVITVVPVAIITLVLFMLFKQTFEKYKLANLTLGLSFFIIWGIIFWMINRNLDSNSYEIAYKAIKTNIIPAEYNKHSDRTAKFESMLTGDAEFKLGSESIAIDSIIHNNTVIKHSHSNKEKASEIEAEQNLFDTEYLSQIKEINDTENATVYYHEKANVKTTPLSELNFETTVTVLTETAPGEEIIDKTTTIIEPVKLKKNGAISLIDVDKKGKLKFKTDEKIEEIIAIDKENGVETPVIKASVVKIKENEVEIPATWFLILNSLFIIMFAPLFSKWWESKFNPSASSKYGLGLILLGVGFGVLAFGSMGIEPGAKTASISMVWLILAYLFHTLGELCLSPVALSYVSKLVPGRMIAMMFGIWYIAVAIGNKLAGILGGQIDKITENYDMTTFFLIFTIAPILFGLIGVFLNPMIKKLMHGVK